MKLGRTGDEKERRKENQLTTKFGGSSTPRQVRRTYAVSSQLALVKDVRYKHSGEDVYRKNGKNLYCTLKDGEHFAVIVVFYQ
jgi:hypothetical protein